MKQLLLYMLFFLSAISLMDGPWGTSVSIAQSAVEHAASGDSEIYAAEGSHEQVITVCMSANNYADVSSQQTHNFGSQFARRFRPGNIPVKLSPECLPDSQVGIYPYGLCDRNMEYSAIQKSTGYYIYALRRIII